MAWAALDQAEGREAALGTAEEIPAVDERAVAARNDLIAGAIRYTTTQTTTCKYLATADGTVNWVLTTDNTTITSDVDLADCP